MDTYEITKEQADLVIDYITNYDRLNTEQIRLFQSIKSEADALEISAAKVSSSAIVRTAEELAELRARHSEAFKGLTDNEKRYATELSAVLNGVIDEQRDRIADVLRERTEEERSIQTLIRTQTSARKRLQSEIDKEKEATEKAEEAKVLAIKNANAELALQIKMMQQAADIAYRIVAGIKELPFDSIDYLKSQGADVRQGTGQTTAGLMGMFPEETETTEEDPAWLLDYQERVNAAAMFAKQITDIWKNSYAEQRAALEEARAQGKISETEYSAGVIQIRRQETDAYIGLLKQAAGSNIKLQQQIAIAEQAIRIGQALTDIKMSIAVGKAKAAAASPPPGNFVLIATFLAQVAGLYAQVQALKNEKSVAVKGFSEGGYTGSGG